MAECTDLSISPSDPPLVAIALGGNVGQPRHTLAAAVSALQQVPEINVLRCSRWYRTHPLGPPQPDYWNGCVIATVNLSPLALLEHLQGIEQQFGRTRHQRWGPRTLDLDLLAVEDVVLDSPDLVLPHPRLAERAFVLVPWAALEPDLVLPGLGRVAQLRDALDCSGIEAIP